MDYSEFKSEIESGKRRPAYLFSGLSSVAVDQALDSIEEAKPASATMVVREKFFAAEGLSEALISMRSLPMWGEHKLIILLGAESLAGEEMERPLTELLAYLNRPSDWATVVLISEAGVPVKFAPKLGPGVVSVGPPTGEASDLRSWARRRLEAAGLRIHPEAMELLIRTCHEDWTALEMELEKILAAFPSGSIVGPTQLQFLVAPEVEENIFDLLRLLVDGQIGEALERLTHRLRLSRNARSEMIAFWSFLYKQVRDWAAMKEIVRRESGAEEMQMAGLSPKARWILEKQSASFSKSNLRNMLRRLEQVDRQLKSGYTALPSVLLETYMIGLHQIRSRRR
jgi:DNA polymerase III delta subunit